MMSKNKLEVKTAASESTLTSRLDSFVQSALADNIWVAIDADAIEQASPCSDFAELIIKALEAAISGCRRSVRGENRSVRLRSKFDERHLLVKIQYSCGDAEAFDSDELSGLAGIAKHRGYYFKSLIENGTANFNIAADIIPG